jgi:UDP-2,3-diacylglucosamine pyrophosphatase LpxH
MTNLLIVSDVHLSRLRPRMMIGGQRELGRFLEHFAEHRREGRPWRLLLNGDLFDFDHHALTIAERGPEPESLRIFGEIADEYPEVFEALGRFLDAGNEVVVIPGNHDLDLMWPSVREAFRVRIAAQVRHPDAMERLSFREWFYYEPGRIWVEHGQQYDSDTSTPRLLDPFEEGPRLQTNLGTHWISDFCPNIPEIAYHVDHTRSTLYYLPVMIRYYGLKAPWMWCKYIAFALRTLLAAGRGNARRSDAHAARRAELARESGVPESVLLEFEAVVPSRFTSRVETGARLHILPALLLPAVLVLGVLGIALGSWGFGLAAGLAGALAIAVSTIVSSRYHGHIEECLRLHARRVESALEVPIVSFGHVHVATEEPVGEGRYLNTGTWVSPHLPCHYVEVVGTDARLCAWPSAPRDAQAKAA